ncbi:MAG: hypothetical protein ACR2PZ_25560 [Pseudomonadales bacterium]
MQHRFATSHPSRLLGLALLAVVVSGCATKGLLERQSTTLKKANLGPDDKFAVAVTLPRVPPQTMHDILVEPLAPKLAVLVSQELGVSAEAVDHAESGAWLAHQKVANEAQTEEKRRFYQRQKAPNYSPFFRDADFAGYALLTLEENTDGFSRNDLDYSLRGTFELRSLERNDKGEPTETLLSRVALTPTVCSRQLRVPPKREQMVIATDGYKLSNPNRCLTLLGNKVGEQIRALLQ